LDVKLAEEVLAKLTSEGWQGRVKTVLTSGIAREAEIKKVWAGPLFEAVRAAEGKVTQAENALKQAQDEKENTRQIFDRALLVAMGETPASEGFHQQMKVWLQCCLRGMLWGSRGPPSKL